MHNNDVHAYTTLDAYQSGFLVLRGHSPELISEGPRIVFSFHPTPKLFEDISDYNSGSTVEALRLVNTIKTLKARIFQRKREENGYYHTRTSRP